MRTAQYITHISSDGDRWDLLSWNYYGDALTLPEGYAYGWTYIPHFIHVRFYTYASTMRHACAVSSIA